MTSLCNINAFRVTLSHMSSFLLCLRIECLRRSSTPNKWWSFFSLLNWKLPAAKPNSQRFKHKSCFYVSTCHMFNKTRRTFKNNVIAKTMLCSLNKRNTFGCVWSVSTMLTRYVDSGQGQPQGSYWGPCVLSQPGYGRDVEKTQRGPQFSCFPSIWTWWSRSRLFFTAFRHFAAWLCWMRCERGRGQYLIFPPPAHLSAVIWYLEVKWVTFDPLFPHSI